MAVTNAASLITLKVGYKDGAIFSKTLLLNTARILDTRLDGAVCGFWYLMEPADLKHPAVYFKADTATERAVLWQINRADANQGRFRIHVKRSRKPGRSEVVVDAMRDVNIDQIIWGYDNSDVVPNTGSWIWISRGSDVYRWETSHSILDIVRSSSKSASLSRSPMS